MRGPTLVIALDVPEKRNAISRAMCERITAELDTAADRPEVRAIVITGENGTFCAGGDFDDMSDRGIGGWRDHFDHVTRLARRLIAYQKPVVAAIEGWAVGAGISLACCCDIIVSADNARFAYGFDKMGVMPDVALIHTLPLRVGVVRARQIMLWGETFDAAGALADGLVDRLVEPGKALDEALALTGKVADKAPLPIGYLKFFLSAGLDEALAFEKNSGSALFTTADHREGISAFREKRQPVFVGA
jgi:enoyl-CoA hydratase/carnithine racemase